jgi:cytochrome P450
VPPEDQAAFHALAPDVAVGFEIQPIRTIDDEARAENAMIALVDYLEGLIERKRQQPGDDLLSALVTVEDNGDRLSHDELLATVILILFAGHETTANLIGNGTYALLTEGTEWNRLVGQPQLARSAVEEVLRFDSPVQIVQRIALGDVELGGRTIQKGNILGILLGAGNRDPEHFPEPNRLDITRDDAPLIAFGGGVHFCLGAPLARLEAQIALGGLARRIPDLQLDGDPERRSSFLIRGFNSLPVRVN